MANKTLLCLRMKCFVLWHNKGEENARAAIRQSDSTFNCREPSTSSMVEQWAYFTEVYKKRITREKKKLDVSTATRGIAWSFRAFLSMRAVSLCLRARESEHSSKFCEQFEQTPNFASTFKLNGTIQYPSKIGKLPNMRMPTCLCLCWCRAEKGLAVKRVVRPGWSVVGVLVTIEDKDLLKTTRISTQFRNV